MSISKKEENVSQFQSKKFIQFQASKNHQHIVHEDPHNSVPSTSKTVKVPCEQLFNSDNVSCTYIR